MTPFVVVDRDDGLEAPDDDSFSCWVRAALLGAQHPDESAEVSLRINDRDEMAQLNQQYRHKSGPTNVLSFPADLPPEVDSPLLGDIAICAPVVMEEALDQQKSLESHWAHMTVHGVLHLLGYDHIQDDEAERMEALETQILGSLGYDDPYQLLTDSVRAHSE